MIEPDRQVALPAAHCDWSIIWTISKRIRGITRVQIKYTPNKGKPRIGNRRRPHIGIAIYLSPQLRRLASTGIWEPSIRGERGVGQCDACWNASAMQIDIDAKTFKPKNLIWKTKGWGAVLIICIACGIFEFECYIRREIDTGTLNSRNGRRCSMYMTFWRIP